MHLTLSCFLIYVVHTYSQRAYDSMVSFLSAYDIGTLVFLLMCSYK